MLDAACPSDHLPCDFLAFLRGSRGLEPAVSLDLLGEWLLARHPGLSQALRDATSKRDVRSAA
jgi:hypothetical protein